VTHTYEDVFLGIRSSSSKVNEFDPSVAPNCTLTTSTQRIIFYEAPYWVFALAYTVFAMFVVAAWWYSPPTRRRRRDGA
jgi:hypothetical protein